MNRTDSRRAQFCPPPKWTPPGPYIRLFRYPRDFDKEGRPLRQFTSGDTWSLSLGEAEDLSRDLLDALHAAKQAQP